MPRNARKCYGWGVFAGCKSLRFSAFNTLIIGLCQLSADTTMKSFKNDASFAVARWLLGRLGGWLVAGLVLLGWMEAPLLRADPGDVDLSFNIGTGPNQNVFCTVIRTNDDKIYIGGTFDGYNGNVARRIARLTVSGAFDPTFATPGCESSVNAIALWPQVVTNTAAGKCLSWAISRRWATRLRAG